MWPGRPSSPGPTSLRVAKWLFEITSVWVGACGLMSSNTRTCRSSCTIFDGISLRAILQNRQSAMVLSPDLRSGPDPLDAGPQGLQLRLHPLVSPVDVVGAVDDRLALGREAGDDETGGGAQVAGHDRGPRQGRRSRHDRRLPV